MILTNLRRQIVGLINDSNLSIDAIYFLLKDILIEIESIYTNELRKEQEELFKQFEDKKEQEQKEEE